MSAQPPVIDDMAAPCLAFPPSSSTTSTVSIHSLHAHPDHPQLQDLLDWDELPPSFCHINNTMEPTMSKHMPEDVESILKLVFKDAWPVYLGFNTNGDLCAATWAQQDQIILIVDMLSDVQPPSMPS